MQYWCTFFSGFVSPNPCACTQYKDLKMAENSTPVLKTTSVIVGESAPAAYKPLNGQEGKAAEIAAQARSESTAPATYKGAVAGTEGTAKQIVDANRTTDTATSKQVADKNLDLMDPQNLNEIDTSSGMP